MTHTPTDVQLLNDALLLAAKQRDELVAALESEREKWSVRVILNLRADIAVLEAERDGLVAALQEIADADNFSPLEFAARAQSIARAAIAKVTP